MERIHQNSFDTALSPVSRRIEPYLRRLPQEVKDRTQEIRLRVNCPVSLYTGGKNRFLTDRGVSSPGGENIVAFREDIDETFRSLCSSSVYSHQNEIKNGYVTIRGGHRVGVCGTAVVVGGRVEGVRDISSLNIRIARQIDGAANELIRLLGEEVFRGVLLVGAPASGKTTILRDLARQLSSGARKSPRKVAVVDERGELAGTFLGEAQNDLGDCCDVLDGYPKGEGILQAVRTLSPELIVCDELGGDADAAAVEAGLNAGVGMVASLHAGSVEELIKRGQAQRLLLTGAFQTAVLLDGRERPGKIKGIYKAGELLDQIDRDYHRGGGLRAGGLYGIA